MSAKFLSLRMIAPSSLASKSAWLTGLLTLVATAGGCQWVFGDFEFHQEDGTGGAKSAGGNSATGGNGAAAVGGGASCATANARRCDPSRNGQPQVCSNGVWTNDGNPCSPSTLCNFSTGVCDVCASGSYRCTTSASGASTVEVCKGTSDGWTLSSTCTSPNFCNADMGGCVACNSTDVRCSTSVATSKLVCRGDQTGFDEVPCTGGLPCLTVSATLGYCAQCTVGSLPVCSTAGVLFSCGSDQRYVPTSCPNGCVNATATTGAFCKP